MSPLQWHTNTSCAVITIISLRLLALILCSNCSNTFNKVLTPMWRHIVKLLFATSEHHFSLLKMRHGWSKHFTSRYDPSTPYHPPPLPRPWPNRRTIAELGSTRDTTRDACKSEQHPLSGKHRGHSKGCKTVTGSKQQKNNTRDSNVVPHRSTNLASDCLTSESGRDPVLSVVYGRSWHLSKQSITYTH